MVFNQWATNIKRGTLKNLHNNVAYIKKYFRKDYALATHQLGEPSGQNILKHT